MREIRPSGSEGGGLEFNRFSLPLSKSSRVTKNLGISSTEVTENSG